jgi:hypothetical protein
MPRRLTLTWPDVGFFKLNGEPADVDRIQAVPVIEAVADQRTALKQLPQKHQPGAIPGQHLHTVRPFRAKHINRSREGSLQSRS